MKVNAKANHLKWGEWGEEVLRGQSSQDKAPLGQPQVAVGKSMSYASFSPGFCMYVLSKPLQPPSQPVSRNTEANGLFHSTER